jgi:hypothetical protein
MCLECDGYSHEEAMQALDLRIRVNGWALVQVKGDDTAWCYTVGLVENYDHPELALLDVELDYQSKLMTALVEGVVARGELSPLLLLAERLRCVEVHPDHLRGELFGTWANRYGDFPEPGEMVQILLPDDAYCEYHVWAVRRLDRPGPLPPVLRAPNRSERRRRDRRNGAA